MIVTVTPNAAIDKTLNVANFQLGQRHRCQRGESLAGGKGINVARALKRLGEPVVACGLAGGRNGTLIVEDLMREGILNDFVRIADESRMTTVVTDPTIGRQTEIFEYGPEVEPAELAVLSEKLRYLSASASAIVLAGSLPRRVDPDWYAQTVRDLRRRDVELIVDSEGDPLRQAFAANPDWVAPNQAEAEEMVGHEFSTDADFALALDEIAEMGPRNVLITRENGVHALVREGPKTRRFQVDVEPGRAGLDGRIRRRAAGRFPGRARAQAAGRGVPAAGRRMRHRQHALGRAPGGFDPRDATRFAGTLSGNRADRLGRLSAAGPGTRPACRGRPPPSLGSSKANDFRRPAVRSFIAGRCGGDAGW